MPGASRGRPRRRAGAATGTDAGDARAAAAIRYRGRTARQSESRERRRAILEAALRLIAREGMRGVRHRAIAREAGVPLAATTYYFRDLSDLIADAFTLYAEDTLDESRALEQDSLAALARYRADDLHSATVRAELARMLSDRLVEHVRSQVRSRRERILEHAFRNEALRSPKLAATAEIPRARTLRTIAGFLERCGSSDPEADAEIVFGVVLHLEYQVLVGEGDEALVRRTLRRLSEHLFGREAAPTAGSRPARPR